ncbi:MAG: hypothetical protein CALGDGBN_00109 [Pseudomonadales bacterium]|nr:hypothetical protein [Pseudomonadales bacterium]
MNASGIFPPTTGELLELVGALYEGPLEEEPWRGFAERLRVLFEARNVAVTLHHPRGRVSDIYVMARDPSDHTDWAAVEAIYRRDFMHEDPFRLELVRPGQVLRLDAAPRSPEFARFEAALGIGSCLRAGFAEPGGMQGWIDIVRGRTHGVAFGAAHTGLLDTLQPHLARALALHAAQRSRAAECAAYEDAIEHVALGTLLLDGELRVLRANRVAAAILAARPGLAIVHGRLCADGAGVQCELDRALRSAATIAIDGDAVPRADLLRLGHTAGPALGVLVRPLTQARWFRGAHAPCVVVYLTDPAQPLQALHPGRQSSRELVERLFGLTPQEARLTLLLADGASLAAAARQLAVAESAVRSYSKRIYAKTGIGTRSELVRLVHRSLALLG